MTLDEAIKGYARAVVLIDFALKRMSNDDVARAMDDLQAARDQLDLTVKHLGIGE